MAVQAAGLHRHNQRGISGDPETGADAIVLSGGYANEEDYGELIVYVGERGIDRETGEHVADQQLNDGNLALVKSFTDGLPVRVIRGRTRRTRHPSAWTPASGYRYDGLFRVESFWEERPSHGFRIYRFRLVAHAASPPAPIASGPARIETSIQRIVRSSALARRVKEQRNHVCQFCGSIVVLPGGLRYSEAAHIRPLGRPHDGPDTTDNIVCLCPTCHVRLDAGALYIDSTGYGCDALTSERVTAQPIAGVGQEHAAYHRQLCGVD